MHLDNDVDPVALLRVTPRPIGQAARVEVQIDGHVVAKALGHREQRLQFDLFHGSARRPCHASLHEWPREPRRPRMARVSP